MKLGRWFKKKQTLLCVIYLSTMTLLAAVGPSISPYSYEEQNIAERLESPSWSHWMGTDILGRDLLTRVLVGARYSLAIGIFTAITALCIGTTVGAIAGYQGSWMDSLLMRLVDVLLIFPSILMAILVMMLLGRGFTGIFLALSITSWLSIARLVRGQVLSLKTLTFVEAAKASGASPTVILFKHIVPNLLGPVLVSLTILIPHNIMAESFLSFIGLGLEPPHASWGTLTNEGFRAMMSYPYLILFPGSILFITLLVFNILGDSLTDLLDVRLS